MCCGLKSSVNEDIPDSGNTTGTPTNDESSKNQNDYRSSLLVRTALNPFLTNGFAYDFYFVVPVFFLWAQKVIVSFILFSMKIF